MEMSLLMNRKIRFTPILIACLAALVIVSPALAFPPLPSSFYGTVKVNGENAAEGTQVRALIDGNPYAEGRTQLYQGESVFTLDIKGDDPETPARDGGVEGDAIQFEVGGVIAKESGVWHGGTNVQLNLTLSASSALNTPAASQAPIPTQTPILAPPQGAVSGATPPAASSSIPKAQAGGSTNLAWFVAGGLLVLAALGFGFQRARRSTRKG